MVVTANTMEYVFKKINLAVVKKLKECKLLVLDFDGVLTENGVFVDENGKETVRCDRSDGLGLELVRRHGGIDTLILSTELNPVVAARAKKLKIPAIQTDLPKTDSLSAEAKSRNLPLDDICYVGNDLNDLGCMKKVGLAVAVNDAYSQVKKAAAYVTKANGGRGAVREICELILYAKKKHPHP